MYITRMRSGEEEKREKKFSPTIIISITLCAPCGSDAVCSFFYLLFNDSIVQQRSPPYPYRKKLIYKLRPYTCVRALHLLLSFRKSNAKLIR